MALSAGEQVSVRRYCGYGLSPIVPDDLDLVMTALTTEQEAVVRTTFLPSLVAIEASILTAADGLDTAKAAVWERNANEMAERSLLYRFRRMALCRFLGIELGLAILLDPILVVPDPCCKGSGGGGAVIPTDPITGDAFVPAVFVV